MCLENLRESKENSVARAGWSVTRVWTQPCNGSLLVHSQASYPLAVGQKTHRFKTHKSHRLLEQFKPKHTVRSKWKKVEWIDMLRPGYEQREGPCPLNSVLPNVPLSCFSLCRIGLPRWWCGYEDHRWGWGRRCLESAQLSSLESLVRSCGVNLRSTYGLYLHVQDRGQVGLCTGVTNKWLK